MIALEKKEDKPVRIEAQGGWATAEDRNASGNLRAGTDLSLAKA
ncbi:hypothetical protein [Varunaivibrio sulfuroxidans]|nr:hypothetical protein [Varunaivibrio sulfuroxidans]WES30915.1 hypothetical protein P3M64_00640 [Varunaivibrio sulfuroxidans]